MNTHKRLGILVALVCCLVLCPQVAGGNSLTTKTATISDVTVKYRIPCEDGINTLNLGDIAITLADEATASRLDATFTVDAEDQTNLIWNCMELHWLQLVWHLDPPAPTWGNGKQPTIPIIDPPSGGWDYQLPLGDDKLPWYFNSTEEAGRYDSDNDGTVEPTDKRVTTKRKEYNLWDEPADRIDPNWVGFSSYLMATVSWECPNALPDCLDKNEMLLLAGFDWTTSSTDIAISDTFKAPSPFDVSQITTALGNAGFAGWTVYDDKVICCYVPEPMTFIGFFLGVSWVRVYIRKRLNPNT